MLLFNLLNNLGLQWIVGRRGGCLRNGNGGSQLVVNIWLGQGCSHFQANWTVRVVAASDLGVNAPCGRVTSVVRATLSIVTLHKEAYAHTFITGVVTCAEIVVVTVDTVGQHDGIALEVCTEAYEAVTDTTVLVVETFNLPHSGRD